MNEIRVQWEIEEEVGQRRTGWRLCGENTRAFGVDVINMVWDRKGLRKKYTNDWL